MCHLRLTNFWWTVNIFCIKDRSQAKNENLGQCWNELGLGDDHVNASGSGLDDVQALHWQRQPILKIQIWGRYIFWHQTQYNFLYFLFLDLSPWSSVSKSKDRYLGEPLATYNSQPPSPPPPTLVSLTPKRRNIAKCKKHKKIMRSTLPIYVAQSQS